MSYTIQTLTQAIKANELDEAAVLQALEVPFEASSSSKPITHVDFEEQSALILAIAKRGFNKALFSVFDHKFLQGMTRIAKLVTAFRAALVNAQAHTCELLIEAGVLTRLETKHFNQFLIDAAQGGLNQYVELLISMGADVNHGRGKTPALTAALTHNRTATALELMAHKADINIVDSSNKTPLDHAVEMGLKDAVELLLSAGAKTNTAFSKQGSANMLDVALAHEHLDIADMLLNARVTPRYNQFSSHLLTAAIQGNPITTAWLLAHGADPNYKETERETPFELAFFHRKDLQTACIIIEHEKFLGRTILCFAIQLCQALPDDKLNLIFRAFPFYVYADMPRCDRSGLHASDFLYLRGRMDLAQAIAAKVQDYTWSKAEFHKRIRKIDDHIHAYTSSLNAEEQGRILSALPVSLIDIEKINKESLTRYEEPTAISPIEKIYDALTQQTHHIPCYTYSLLGRIALEAFNNKGVACYYYREASHNIDEAYPEKQFEIHHQYGHSIFFATLEELTTQDDDGDPVALFDSPAARYQEAISHGLAVVHFATKPDSHEAKEQEAFSNVIFRQMLIEAIPHATDIQIGELKQNPLHLLMLYYPNFMEEVQFNTHMDMKDPELLNALYQEDLLGLTPIDYAFILNRQEFLKSLSGLDEAFRAELAEYNKTTRYATSERCATLTAYTDQDTLLLTLFQQESPHKTCLQEDDKKIVDSLHASSEACLTLKEPVTGLLPCDYLRITGNKELADRFEPANMTDEKTQLRLSTGSRQNFKLIQNDQQRLNFLGSSRLPEILCFHPHPSAIDFFVVANILFNTGEKSKDDDCSESDDLNEATVAALLDRLLALEAQHPFGANLLAGFLLYSVPNHELALSYFCVAFDHIFEKGVSQTQLRDLHFELSRILFLNEDLNQFEVTFENGYSKSICTTERERLTLALEHAVRARAFCAEDDDEVIDFLHTVLDKCLLMENIHVTPLRQNPLHLFAMYHHEAFLEFLEQTFPTEHNYAAFTPLQQRVKWLLGDRDQLEGIPTSYFGACDDRILPTPYPRGVITIAWMHKEVCTEQKINNACKKYNLTKPLLDKHVKNHTLHQHIFTLERKSTLFQHTSSSTPSTSASILDTPPTVLHSQNGKAENPDVGTSSTPLPEDSRENLNEKCKIS